MPVQVVPPMYNMLADEIKWALADVRYYFSPVVFSLSEVLIALGNRENHTALRISSSFLVCTTFLKKKSRY